MLYPSLRDEIKPSRDTVLCDSEVIADNKCKKGQMMRYKKYNEKMMIPEFEALTFVDLAMKRVMNKIGQAF